jgi:hypothetical protein
MSIEAVHLIVKYLPLVLQQLSIIIITHGLKILLGINQREREREREKERENDGNAKNRRRRNSKKTEEMSQIKLLCIN